MKNIKRRKILNLLKNNFYRPKKPENTAANFGLWTSGLEL
jgi:hypothetical protein